jgi:hypothetical protein
MHGLVTALLAVGPAMRVLDTHSLAAVDTLWLAVGAVASTAAVAVVGSTAAAVVDMAVVVTGNAFGRSTGNGWQSASRFPFGSSPSKSPSPAKLCWLQVGSAPGQGDARAATIWAILSAAWG